MQTLAGRGTPRCRDPVTESELVGTVESKLDMTKLRCRDGEYLGSEELAVGEIVRLNSGRVGRVEQVRQSNYLPRFKINGKWLGKTHIRGKLKTPG